MITLYDEQLDPGTPVQNTIAAIVILLAIVLVIIGSTKGGGKR